MTKSTKNIQYGLLKTSLHSSRQSKHIKSRKPFTFSRYIPGKMKFINLKISRENIFLLHNMAHVRSSKIFTISVQTFEILDFESFKAPETNF